LSAINGAIMLLAGATWHAAISAAAPIGHYQEHAVADAGAAFIAAGLGLIARALNPRWRPVAIAAFGFIALHGVVHVFGVTGGHTHDSIASISLFVIPAILAASAALPRGRNESA
jgi:hypothetical protein